MRAIGAAIAVCVGLSLAAAGCEDNETTLFIEHLKAPADSPKCSTAKGDDRAVHIYVDLALASSYTGHYYVTNQAMTRESYENLSAETNGVFIEGAEVYVTTAGGSVIGSTEYYEFQHYISPESSDIVPAVVITQGVIEALADANDCDWVETATTVANGGWVVEEWYDPVYSVVRFLGHTNGGIDVETQEFSFMLQPCCNCLVDWSDCYDECTRYCNEPEAQPTCYAGVYSNTGNSNKYDCKNWFYGTMNEWADPDVDGGVNSCDICAD